MHTLAFFSDEAHGGMFVVKRIGGDEGVFQPDLRIGQQGAGLADLAVFLFPGGGDHGAIIGQFRGAHQDEGVGASGLSQSFFWSLVRDVIIGVFLGNALGVASAGPVGGFVNGAGVAFGIA